MSFNNHLSSYQYISFFIGIILYLYVRVKKMAKTFNMIVLGGLLKIRPIVSIESVVKALRKTLPERHHNLIPMNEEAIRIGMDIIKKMD